MLKYIIVYNIAKTKSYKQKISNNEEIAPEYIQW